MSGPVCTACILMAGFEETRHVVECFPRQIHERFIVSFSARSLGVSGAGDLPILQSAQAAAVLGHR